MFNADVKKFLKSKGVNLLNKNMSGEEYQNLYDSLTKIYMDTKEDKQ
jgi:hypothetical protein